jgi:genome maintenance exonuclease 1
VTSILDATKSEEDKAALANWRERTGQKEAEAITKAASSRGSKMHNYLESFLLGRENLSFFEDGEQYKSMAKQIIDKGLKNRLEEIWGVECTLYYPEKYAGTADCVGVYEGQSCIIDFKQSNKPKKAEYIDSWFLQTSAYSLAHNIVYNTNITSCVILVCTVDNLFQEFKIQGSELITYQNLFLGRLKKFNELSNLI